MRDGHRAVGILARVVAFFAFGFCVYAVLVVAAAFVVNPAGAIGLMIGDPRTAQSVMQLFRAATLSAIAVLARRYARWPEQRRTASTAVLLVAALVFAVLTAFVSPTTSLVLTLIAISVGGASIVGARVST